MGRIITALDCIVVCLNVIRKNSMELNSSCISQFQEWMSWHIEARTKWTPFRWRHFQMMEMFAFQLKFRWSSQGSN